MVEWSVPIYYTDKGKGSDVGDDVKGVYLVCEKREKCVKVHYVGQTSRTVSKRMSEHGKDDEPNKALRDFVQKEKHGSLRFYFFEEDDKDKRNDYEKTLYIKYGGPEGRLFNEAEPPNGAEVDMDFPDFTACSG